MKVESINNTTTTLNLEKSTNSLLSCSLSEDDPQIKIKTEKIDPEIDAKICGTFLNIEQNTIEKDDNNANSNENSQEDKKNIELVKSSNEILAELFKVFNAAPPTELLDNEALLRKSKSKKRKKEKRKRSKSKDSSYDKSNCDEDDSETELAKHEKKKHKKKKHKHKEHKKKIKDEKTEDAIENTSPIKKSQIEADIKEIDKNNKKRIATPENIEKPIEKTKRFVESEKSFNTKSRSDSKNNNFYNGYKDKTKRITGNGISKDQDVSDISLSDEETYLREREINRTRARSHNVQYNNRDIRRSSRNERSSNFEKRYSKNRSHRHSTRTKSRSRSRSNSSQRSLGIDKKRLLEIARKQAISMIKLGSLPGCTGMSDEVKDKVLFKMRYGGKTVQDLTEFCKKISNGEKLSDLSSDEDSDTDKKGNPKAFHHPFQLKEREPIVMHIRNTTNIPTRKTEEQTKAITMQFPVSSGQQHRMTEAWIPVPPKENPINSAQTSTVSQLTNIIKNTPKNVFEKPIPLQEEQEPAFRPLVGENNEVKQNLEPSSASNALYSMIDKNLTMHELPTPVYNTPTPQPVPPPVIPAQIPPTAFVADVPVPSSNIQPPTTNKISVFPQTEGNEVHVATIISNRLSALRRLQDNPQDADALKMMQNCQVGISSWVSAKQIPGQFTGSTGVNVLKAHELNSGPQLWARRDQLISTQPVTGGMGMYLLQKMGWKPGEGLGREKTGALQPLLLDVKLDKRGLVAKEDRKNGQKHRQQQQSSQMNFNKKSQMAINPANKHPVCLLNELAGQKRCTPPVYNLVNEEGPSHHKMFLFSVLINGQTYTSDKSANTKKEAKMLAARYCLQQMGVLECN